MYQMPGDTMELKVNESFSPGNMSRNDTRNTTGILSIYILQNCMFISG